MAKKKASAAVPPTNLTPAPATLSAQWLHYCVALDKPGDDVRFRQARWWLKSLIEIAEWQGPIVLVSNQPRDLKELAGRVKLVLVEFADFDAEGAQPAAQTLRVQIADELASAIGRPLADLAGVFYADVDCLARESLEPLLASLPEEADAAVTWEKGRNMGRFWVNNGLFADDEIDDAKRHRGIQSGTLFVRGRVAQSFFDDWEAILQGPRRQGRHYFCDQTGLNRLVWLTYHSRLPYRIHHLPLPVIAFPFSETRRFMDKRQRDAASLWHLCGPAQEERIRHARAQVFLLKRIKGTRSPFLLADRQQRCPVGIDTNNITDGLKDFVREWVPEEGTYVETGTYWGVSAEAVAELRPRLRLITIDPAPQPEADARLERFAQVERWREDSRQAAAKFADASIDVLYLDAEHYRDFVLAELDAWIPKVKPGGIIAGHDWPNIPDVVSAVRESLGDFPDRVYSDTTWVYRLPA